MNDTPPDWVLIEAAKRCGRSALTKQKLRGWYGYDTVFGALCDMILKHEQPPVDRKLLCAREATKVFGQQKFASSGYIASDLLEDYVVHAIELWEEGFGK